MQNDTIRIEALRIAMKNPHMNKLIMDGIKSPIRSSRRDQASSVIDSVHNVHLNKTQKKTIPVMVVNQGKGKGGGQGGPIDGQVMFMPQPEPAAPIRVSLRPAILKAYDFKAPTKEAPAPAVIHPQFSGSGGPVEIPAQEMPNPEMVPEKLDGWFARVMSRLNPFKGFTGQGGGLPNNLSYNNLPGGSASNPFNNLHISSPLSLSQSGRPLISNPTPPSVYVGGAPSAPSLSMPSSQSNGLPMMNLNDLIKPKNAAPSPSSSLSYSGQRTPNPLFGNNQSTIIPNSTPSIPNIGFNPTPTAAGKKTKDVSSNFALINGAVFNKAQNKSYNSPQDFYKAAYAMFGGDPNQSFNNTNFVFDTSWKPGGSTTATVTQPGPASSGNSVPFGPGIGANGQAIATPSVAASSTGDPLIDYLMQSVSQGTGSNAFALGAMADAKKLQSLFPGVPLNQIPVGASLAGQLNDLETHLTKEYQVDQLHNSLMSSITTGQNLQPNVEAYIRGKDELLNSVDGMLKNATNEYLNSSAGADPFYQKSMGQYMNYLTVLKGRTTQRYVDYLNTAITYQNNQVNQLQTAYNDAANKVNQLYTQQAAVTTEQYSQIKDTLTQMYDNVSARAGLLNGTSKNAIDLQKSSADLAATVLKNAALITNTSDRQSYINQYAGSAGLTGLNAAALSTKSGSGNLSANDLATVDSRVAVAPDLNSALSDPVLIQNGVNPDVIAQKYAETKASSDASSVKSDPSRVDTMYNSFRSESKQLQSLIDSAKQSGGDITALQTLKDNYDRTRDGGFLKGITSLVSENIDNVRKVLSEMKTKNDYNDWSSAAPGMFNFTANKNKSDYTKFLGLGQYLFTVAKANSNMDFSKVSADEIAAAIFGQFPS